MYLYMMLEELLPQAKAGSSRKLSRSTSETGVKGAEKIGSTDPTQWLLLKHYKI